jgi:hypothetical protein
LEKLDHGLRHGLHDYCHDHFLDQAPILHHVANVSTPQSKDHR